MSITSFFLTHKKMFAVIAALAIVTMYMIPYDSLTEAFAARGGGGGGGGGGQGGGGGGGGGGQGGGGHGGGGGGGGCKPYCHVKP
jgi:hypothetical protein